MTFKYTSKQKKNIPETLQLVENQLNSTTHQNVLLEMMARLSSEP